MLVLSMTLKDRTATLFQLGSSQAIWVETSSSSDRLVRVSTMVSETVDSYTRLTGVLTPTVLLTSVLLKASGYTPHGSMTVMPM